MKKIITCLILAILCGYAAGYAQKKPKDLGNKLFEEASAREKMPDVQVFIMPEIADLQMLNTEREMFGPYEYALSKDVNSMTNAELDNAKTIALRNAATEAGADLIIEPMYNSIVYDKDSKVIRTTISGYPAKYVNFRKITKEDMEILRTLYPHGIGEAYIDRGATRIISTAEASSK